MANLKWTNEALDWLENIYRYIAQDDTVAAVKVINGIVDKVEMLATFPHIGTRLRAVPEGDVRILLYGHYRIAYLCWKDSSFIEILGVFHSRFDIDSYLPE